MTRSATVGRFRAPDWPVTGRHGGHPRGIVLIYPYPARRSTDAGEGRARFESGPRAESAGRLDVGPGRL